MGWIGIAVTTILLALCLGSAIFVVVYDEQRHDFPFLHWDNITRAEWLRALLIHDGLGLVALMFLLFGVAAVALWRRK
jgi:hypothetical protein